MTTPGMAQSLCVTEITRVSKAFHPTFTTCARAYAYLIDIGSNRISSSQTVERDDLSRSSTLGTFDMLVEEKVEESDVFPLSPDFVVTRFILVIGWLVE